MTTAWHAKQNTAGEQTPATARHLQYQEACHEARHDCIDASQPSPPAEFLPDEVACTAPCPAEQERCTRATAQHACCAFVSLLHVLSRGLALFSSQCKSGFQTAYTEADAASVCQRCPLGQTSFGYDCFDAVCKGPKGQPVCDNACCGDSNCPASHDTC